LKRPAGRPAATAAQDGLVGLTCDTTSWRALDQNELYWHVAAMASARALNPGSPCSAALRIRPRDLRVSAGRRAYIEARTANQFDVASQLSAAAWAARCRMPASNVADQAGAALGRAGTGAAEEAQLQWR
jgi:hypothetical protein